MANKKKRYRTVKIVEINDIEFLWLYILDSGRWIKRREEMKVIAEDLMEKSETVKGIMRYFTADELEVLSEAEKKWKAVIKFDNDDVKELLQSYYKSDMDNIDPEYLEGLRFFRAKLADFKIQLPDNSMAPINVRVLFHQSGVLILEFFLRIQDMNLTPDVINELQLLPREEIELTFELPRELLQDYSKINPDIRKILANKPDKKVFKRTMTLHELVWIYWAIIIHIATEEKAKDSKSLQHLLRYNVFDYYPIMIFNFPEFQSPEALLEKYKSELYTILVQEMDLPVEYLRSEFIDEAFDQSRNLTERTDNAIYFAMESCICINTQLSEKIFELRAKKKRRSLEEQRLLEKLDVVLVQEFLQLQRFNVEMFDFLLSRKSISEMETDELAQMRGRLSRAIEEFYNVKLLIKTETLKRFEFGRKNTYDLEKSLEVLEKKLDLVDSAVSSIHNNLMEFLSVLLGIVVQVGPIIALAMAEQYPIQAASIAIGVFLAIYFLYKKIYRYWYKRSHI